MTKRDIRIPVLVNEDEKARIEKAADKVGVGVSTYMRIKILEGLPDDGGEE